MADPGWMLGWCPENKNVVIQYCSMQTYVLSYSNSSNYVELKAETEGKKKNQVGVSRQGKGYCRLDRGHTRLNVKKRRNKPQRISKHFCGTPGRGLDVCHVDSSQPLHRSSYLHEMQRGETNKTAASQCRLLH